MTQEMREVMSRVLGDTWSPDRATEGQTLVALGVDSLKMVELVLELESVYGLAIPDEYLVADNFQSVGSVESMMRSLQG